MAEQYLETPIGILLIRAAEAITEIRLVESRGADAPSVLTERAAAQLLAYFDGRCETFDLPLSPRGTPFQRRVWDALREIPYGTQQSYGEVAARIGCRSARAIGQAVGRNPLLIVVPCHRVLAANARLGGFSSGIENKKTLLLLEKISFFV